MNVSLPADSWEEFFDFQSTGPKFEGKFYSLPFFSIFSVSLLSEKIRKKFKKFPSCRF
jgi:hypothetical protein